MSRSTEGPSPRVPSSCRSLGMSRSAEGPCPRVLLGYQLNAFFRVLEGNLAGGFRPMFCHIRSQRPSRSTGLVCSAGCTKNQPRRPFLDPPSWTPRSSFELSIACEGFRQVAGLSMRQYFMLNVLNGDALQCSDRAATRSSRHPRASKDDKLRRTYW
jgi:hypothetical protein